LEFISVGYNTCAAAGTREGAWCGKSVSDPTNGEVFTSHLSFWTKWRISPFANFWN